MKTLPADQIAVRDTDSTKKSREGSRESFERHVKADKRDTGNGNGQSAVTGTELSGRASIDAVQHAAVIAAEKAPVALTAADLMLGGGARIYPQGLAVVGYLSMLAAGSDASSTGTARAAAAGAASETAQSPASSSPFATALEQGDGARREIAPASGQGMASTLEAIDETPDMAPVATGGAELSTWLSRRLSFTGQGASSTLRLRDYRVAESDNGELVNQLLGFAARQGQAVGRIVINGHEVWRRDEVATHNNEQGVTWHGS